RFRRGTVAPIPEYALAEAANEVLTNAGAPSWARASVGELHLFRTAGRPELPRFIGTVESELRLSDLMSPVEAVFLAATLGKELTRTATAKSRRSPRLTKPLKGRNSGAAG